MGSMVKIPDKFQKNNINLTTKNTNYIKQPSVLREFWMSSSWDPRVSKLKKEIRKKIILDSTVYLLN